MKKQNIEDIFSSIEHFSSVPPPELWDKIEEQLDQPKKKKRAVLWWSAAASLLLGLSIPSVLYFNSKSDKAISPGAIENKNVFLNKEIDTDQDSKNSTIKSNTNIQTEKTIRVSSIKNKSEQSNQNAANQNNLVVVEANSSSKVNAETSHEKTKENIKSETIAAKSTLTEEKLPNGFSPNQNTSFKSNDDKGLKNANAVVLNSSLQNKNILKESIAKEKFDAGNKTVIAANDNIQNKNAPKEAVAKDKLDAENKTAIAENDNIQNKNASKEAVRKDKFDAENKTAIAANDNIQNKNISKESVAKDKFDAENKTAIAANDNIQNKNISKESVAKDKFDAENKTAIAANDNIQNKNISKEFIAKDKFDTENKTAIAANDNIQNKTNGSQSGIVTENLPSQKAIAFTERKNTDATVLLTKTDSLQLAELHNLEESLKNPKKEQEIDEKASLISKAEKWSVEVFAGIANSENYKNDKTLGNVNSPKQSNAYGVKTNYKLNKKWAVSSGLKINELGQSLANVSYIDTKSIAFMKPEEVSADRSPSTRISNSTDFVFVASATNDNVTNNVNNGVMNTASFESGDVDQRLKYLEMPFEVSYFILNKNKTTVSLNTGGFVGKLISNDVYLNGSAIGENQNANSFVYGSLLSSTLQYRLYKKTNIFVEPGMNYYVNPLDNQSFNQFQWSFNFGLNVSF
ncbi:hypothetical protein SGQ44_07450 [Flavobacterium sp. Fl-77]|uniref:Outer membrane protein beta-barrel domain-containing protein n=1 Tax=Flavobacterium flavipigmentatum TaxID=2893884 RepID=A0AAJ2SEK5_9FLAO|nr:MULTISPECIES: hypothetical protein [unclassified Flavobacterium]MDX6182502.1 hypothetical protein [Flavobacterium sp. Fl-33]MDX6185585.1 hypothetical protein [Flavobacterium sp. Fl-77]UFH38773.1 hypothetical protein LNP22_00500 [Flavobacterium sp. F-70]